MQKAINDTFELAQSSQRREVLAQKIMLVRAKLLSVLGNLKIEIVIPTRVSFSTYSESKVENSCSTKLAF